MKIGVEDVGSKFEGTQGRWVTEATFAKIHGLSRQTLCNWRYQDRKAGRSEAAEGYPVYRYFGHAVRYFIGDAVDPVLPGQALTPDARRA